jgi:predicted nucleic acid-binding protein
VAKDKLLIDTDVFIDYLNVGFLRTIFEDKDFQIYYSIVTKKELLSKRGLKEAERQAIQFILKRYRVIPLNSKITEKYSEIQMKYPQAGKEDALIAATALVAKLPLVTRNWKHYRNIEGLILFHGL